ncbi:hypothetical protein F3Y22_tig00111392pilonHSYRG00260 [Hibiscus syriacus]|uniref:Transmembrane protein n=1 Tax=Hibiscus syriacus TaxID=106335 RepID=A0A6A2XWW3_HIBSY|nr:hypothetical protein F3Y22_tig00111392pilonHSYRG00260 [Hibiscus syriacus]
MARLSLVLLMVIVVLIFRPTCFEARKLSNFEKEQVSSFKDAFANTDDDKGHAMGDSERLFAVHLDKTDRILQSSPSPGGGHPSNGINYSPIVPLLYLYVVVSVGCVFIVNMLKNFE